MVPIVECFVLFISYTVYHALKTLSFHLLSLLHFRHNHILTVFSHIGRGGVNGAYLVICSQSSHGRRRQGQRQVCLSPNWGYHLILHKREGCLSRHKKNLRSTKISVSFNNSMSLMTCNNHAPNQVFLLHSFLKN